MPVYKDKNNGSWYVMVRYEDWQGKNRQKCKRGFDTKKDAQNWERTFLLQNQGNMDMTFQSFYEIYANDMGLFTRKVISDISVMMSVILSSIAKKTKR